MEVGDDTRGIIGAKLEGNWFTEEPGLITEHGQSFSLKVKEILDHQTSKYQDILVFERLASLA